MVLSNFRIEILAIRALLCALGIIGLRVALDMIMND